MHMPCRFCAVLIPTTASEPRSVTKGSIRCRLRQVDTVAEDGWRKSRPIPSAWSDSLAGHTTVPNSSVICPRRSQASHAWAKNRRQPRRRPSVGLVAGVYPACTLPQRISFRPSPVRISNVMRSAPPRRIREHRPAGHETHPAATTTPSRMSSQPIRRCPVRNLVAQPA